MSANLTPLQSDGGFNTSANVVAGNISTVGTGGDITLTGGNITGANVFTANTFSLPHGSYITEVASPVPGNYALALAGTGNVDPNQQLLIYPTSLEANHLHLTSGNLYNTELFLGNDNLYVKLANTGNVVVNSDDGVGNTAQWNFDITGALNLPPSLGPGSSGFIQTANAYPTLLAYGSNGHGGPELDWANTDIASNLFGNSDVMRHTMYLNDGGLYIGFNENNVANVASPNWNFDPNGNLNVPQGGYIGPAGIKGDGTMLTGGAGNIASLTSFYTDAPGIYSSCFTANPDGTLNLTTYGNGTGIAGQWAFSGTDVTVPGDILAQEGNDLQVKVFNPTASGGVTYVVQNRQVDAGNARTTQFELAPANIVLSTDFSGNKYQWTFDNTGNLNLPGNTFSVNYANGTAVSLGGAGSYGNANVASYLPTYSGNLANLGGDVNTSGNISASGNVTAGGGAYFIGDGSLLTNLPSGGYGNANVATFLGSYGSNTISTTGTINAGNITGGNVLTGGLISATANVTGGNVLTSGNVNFTANAGQINFNNTAYISGNANSITRDGSIVLQPYTGAGSTFPGVVIGGAGRILSPGGSVHLILNPTDFTVQVAQKITVGTVSNSTSTGALQVTGGTGISGNLYVGGNATTGNNAIVAGTTGTLLANSTASFFANVNNYTQITYQNKSTGSDATADFILTADNGNDSVNYGDFGIINSGYDNSTPTNSLGNIVFAADTYLYAQGNVSNTSQSGGNLAIGTSTAGKTVKIFAGGVTNSSIVAYISNTGIAVTGTVSATGNLTSGSFVKGVELTSTNSTGSEGGQINLAIPAANTTLGGTTVTVDVYQNQLRFFEGSANAKGAYIDLTACANGVGTNLVNRASIIAGSNTAVTLDNIQARVGGSPIRLYINTVAGNLTGAGDTQTLLSGSVAVSSWINVPIGQGAANAFAMSGALSSNGDTAILSLIDQGAGSGMWRITGMIANTTANLYGVSIERLV